MVKVVVTEAGQFHTQAELEAYTQELQQAGSVLPRGKALRELPEYIRRSDVDKLLKSLYPDPVLRQRHVGKLWGAMTRVAAQGKLFQGRCRDCGAPLQSHDKRRKCRALTTQHNDGVEIETASLTACRDRFNEVDVRQVGPVIKADFDHLVDALAHQ